ncbi:MAG: sugar phosphate isomerase/epimerase [Anaerolineales bacterium]|nr:sugar phosphate isomerase/epimerase [Anaerolineales bacterium]
MSIIAISSWCWHAAYHAGQLSLLNIPAEAQRLGFNHVELNDFMLPPPRLSRLRRPLLAALNAPQNLWRYSTRALQPLAHTPVQIVSWTLDTNLTVDAWHWLWQKRYLAAGLRAARRLRCAVVRITLGGSEHSPATLDDLVAKRLAQVVRHFAPLTVAVENHWGLSTDYERLLRILDLAQRQLSAQEAARLGMCFDAGNLPAARRECGWRALAPKATHFHFKTRTFTLEGEESTLPYGQIFSLLRASHYHGYIVLEYEGDDAVERGVQKSRALLGRWWPW